MRDDFYEQFGLEKFASKEEVEGIYRKLVFRHHPDRGGDESKMKVINRIHHILTKEKDQYDRWLKSRMQPSIQIKTSSNLYRWASSSSYNDSTTGSTGSGWGYSNG